MDEAFWEEQEIDPSVREHAEREAARLGVSLSDYLLNVLLDEEPASTELDWDLPAAAPSATPRPLDRTLAANTLGRLAEYLEDADTQAKATARSMQRSLQQMQDAVSALDGRVAETEAALTSTAEDYTALRRSSDLRLTSLEDSARTFDAGVQRLSRAHDNLKRAVDDDLAGLAAGLDERVSSALADARAQAEAAASLARSSEAAVLAELRAMRVLADERLSDTAAASRALVEQAFDELATRVDSLAARTVETHREAERARDAMVNRIADFERSTQAAVTGMTRALQQADDAIREQVASMQDAGAEQDKRLDSLSAQIVQNERQARTAREQVAERLNAAEQTASHAVSESHRAAARLEQTLSAEIQRTLHIAREQAHEINALASDIAEHGTAHMALAAQVAANDSRLSASLNDARKGFTAALARADGQIDALGATTATTAARLDTFEERLVSCETETARLDETLKSEVERTEEAIAALSEACQELYAGAEIQLIELNGGAQALRTQLEKTERQLGDSIQSLAAQQRNAQQETAAKLQHIEQTTAERLHAATAPLRQAHALLKDELQHKQQLAVEDIAARVAQAEDALRGALRQTKDAFDDTASVLSREVDALASRASAAQDRIRALEVGQANNAARLDQFGENVDRRFDEAVAGIQARLELAQSESAVRIDAIEARSGHLERVVTQNRRALDADVARVEASTLASLEKLSVDIAAAKQDAQHGAASLAQLLREVSEQAVGTEVSTARALNAQSQALNDAASRIAELERSAGAGEPQVQSLRQDLAQLAQRLSAVEAQAPAAHVASLLESQSAELAKLTARVQELARVLSEVAGQAADAAFQSNERLHRLELAGTEDHLLDFERRQASAIGTLHSQIARFIEENDKRLRLLEARPTAAADTDIAAKFDALRAQIEERVVGVETHNIRALEQLTETMALLEERLCTANLQERVG